ncbi:uncharacterized protein LOC126661424 [Mercurialis annua]|uniref:uncharacterized protein LOC126661424 n=1 Tax=Mercurialis annua TaxID=3986 RepID=UPI00215EC45B|nr:uncharacterized protein LOC126661424 [Mercurialis annua]
MHNQQQQHSNCNGTAPITSQQIFAANPALANLCNLLTNSMPMPMQMQMQMQPQLPPVPFNNSNMYQPPAFANPHMFVNQFNPQCPPFPFNFSNFPQNMATPNLHNPYSGLPIQNPNFFALGNQPNPTQQLNGSMSQMPPMHNSQHAASFNHQDYPINNGQNTASSSNWKKFPNKDFKDNQKQEASPPGHYKTQFQHMNNGKRKFGEHRGKGNGYEREPKFRPNNNSSDVTKQVKEPKRSIARIYTEQEIKQWCEERKKNFPSKANLKKREILTDSGVIDKEAKLRREQLKEILAKQAELGVEVAEIPSHYLLDSEKQVNEKEDKRCMSKRGRFRKKHDRRGRHNKKDKLADKDSSNINSFSQRKPTLLQKLLSADVRKDKLRLLQVFRFMVINSFFDDYPENTLKFDSVSVKEDEVVAEEPSIAGKDISNVSDKTRVENACIVGDNDDSDKHEVQVDEGTCFVRGKSHVDQNDIKEEEGEIID